MCGSEMRIVYCCSGGATVVAGGTIFAADLGFTGRASQNFLVKRQVTLRTGTTDIFP
jgi:hypothetical protein